MPCLKFWIELYTLYIVPRLQNIITILLLIIMMMMMTMCIIIIVIIIHNVIRAPGFLPGEQKFLSCMAFSIYKVVRVFCLWWSCFCLRPPPPPPQEMGNRGCKQNQWCDRQATRTTFVNAKSNAREKLLLAGYQSPSNFVRAQPWKHYGAVLNCYAFKFFLLLHTV